MATLLMALCALAATSDGYPSLGSLDYGEHEDVLVYFSNQETATSDNWYMLVQYKDAQGDGHGIIAALSVSPTTEEIGYKGTLYLDKHLDPATGQKSMIMSMRDAKGKLIQMCGYDELRWIEDDDYVPPGAWVWPTFDWCGEGKNCCSCEAGEGLDSCSVTKYCDEPDFASCICYSFNDGSDTSCSGMCLKDIELDILIEMLPPSS